MDTSDDNVTRQNIMNNIESGVDAYNSTSSHEKSISGMGNTNEYRPLNPFDKDDDTAEGRSRRTTLHRINRKALLSFLALVVVASTIIVLTVVFVVTNGMFCPFTLFCFVSINNVAPNFY